MLPRLFPLAVLTIALSPIARADDPAPAPPATPPQAAAPAPPKEAQNFTGETREQYRDRITKPYVEMLPDLTEDQKTHITAIYDAVGIELRALAADQTLSPERKRAVGRAIRLGVAERINAALTDEQAATYTKIYTERAEATATLEKIGSVRPGERLEEMRARILQGYELVMEELSVKQKTAILEILEAAAEEDAAIQADTKSTDAEKLTALRQVHESVNDKVLPLLDKDQVEDWKKAHAAKRP